MNETVFPPKSHVLLKDECSPLSLQGGRESITVQPSSSVLLQSHPRSSSFIICGVILPPVWLCAYFSLGEVLLPWLLNLMCFIVNNSRMHNSSLWKYVFPKRALSLPHIFCSGSFRLEFHVKKKIIQSIILAHSR